MNTNLAAQPGPAAAARQPTPGLPAREAGDGSQPVRHRGHGWMMIACCLPMLAIAVALWATGVAGRGFLIAAVACTAMMALMMGSMGRGEAAHGHADEETRR